MPPVYIEDVILRHAGVRGMDRLRRYLPVDFCRAAASAILNLRGEVTSPSALIVTGFYVNGAAETDGPPGAFFLYQTLKTLGFSAKILTDEIGKPLFEGALFPGDLVVTPVKIQDEAAFKREIFNTYAPHLICAVERCGRTRDGTYRSMAGKDISPFTAPLDALFLRPGDRCLTVGIGDGGNEVGMGLLRDVILRELSIEPSVVPVRYLILSTVSNWGAYGLIRSLEVLSGKVCLPDPNEVTTWVSRCVERGAVDGISGCPEPKVDGYPLAWEGDVVEVLKGCHPFPASTGRPVH